MKILLFLALVLLIVPTMAADKVNLGTLVADFVLNTPHEVQVNDPTQLSDHNEYWLHVTDNDTQDIVDVYVDDYGGKTVDVSQSQLMANLMDNYILHVMKTTWLPVSSIGGLPGVMTEEITSTGAHFGYDAAFSPDGVGNQGSIVAYVCSLCSKDITDTFLSNLKIRRA